MSHLRSITLHGDRSGWLGEHSISRSVDALAFARALAAESAQRLGEPVEARVITRSGNYLFGTRHVPGVTAV